MSLTLAPQRLLTERRLKFLAEHGYDLAPLLDDPLLREHTPTRSRSHTLRSPSLSLGLLLASILSYLPLSERSRLGYRLT